MSKATGYIVSGAQIVVGAVLSAFGQVQFGVPLIISGVMGLAATALAPTPDTPGGFKNSPTYGWNPTNSTYEGQAKRIVLGEHKVYPSYVSARTFRDGRTQVIKAVLYICSGGTYGIESVSDVRLQDEPIGTFPDATWSYSYGTSSQSAVAGYEFISQPHEVQAKCEKDTWIYYSTRDAVDEVNIILGWMSGLFYAGKDGIVNTNCQVEFQYQDRQADGTYGTDWRTATVYGDQWVAKNKAGKYEIWGQTQSPKYGHARIRWETRGYRRIRVMATSGDNEKWKKTPTWLRSEEILDDQRGYDGNAMLYLTMPATAQLSGGLPRVTCTVKGWKVKNLGASSAAWTQNPAKLRYAFMTDVTNGAGRWISASDLDTSSFTAGATWHDENAASSGIHKQARHQLDLVIDTQSPISEWLAHMDKLFPATCVEHTGKIYYLTDDDGKSSVATFDGRQARSSANRPILKLSDGRADIKETELSTDKRATHVRAKYYDRTDGYVARFTDWIVDPGWTSSLPRIDRELNLPGITREAEAIRICRREINNARYRTKLYDFGVGIGDLQLLPMDLVTLYLDSPALDGVSVLVLGTRIESLHGARITALLWDSDAFAITGDSLQTKADSLTRAEALAKVGQVAKGVSNIVCKEVA